MTDCPRIGKLFGGCKFSPRYDETGRSGPKGDDLFYLAIAGKTVPVTAARKTYLGDVCERCGKTLFRRKPEVKKP